MDSNWNFCCISADDALRRMFRQRVVGRTLASLVHRSCVDDMLSRLQDATNLLVHTRERQEVIFDRLVVHASKNSPIKFEISAVVALEFETHGTPDQLEALETERSDSAAEPQKH